MSASQATPVYLASSQAKQSDNWCGIHLVYYVVGHPRTIALLPAGSEDVASSRIRVYSFAKELDKIGVEHALGMIPNPLAVVIQKRVDAEVLSYAQRMQSQGVPIIYDVDDLGAALDYWVGKGLLERMLTLAEVVVTATEQQGEEIRQRGRIRAIKVISNCVDYYPSGPDRIKHNNSDPLRIFWFGNAYNLSLWNKYAGTLLRVPNTQVVVCTDPSSREKVLSAWPTVDFAPWSLDNFVRVLQSCHVSCLMHDGDRDDRAKGNNRMITSITWGVPAIVSNTSAYECTARDAGVPGTVFCDESGLLATIERLRSGQARERYLDKTQTYIWKNYSPGAIAREYLRIIGSAVIGRKDGRAGLVPSWAPLPPADYLDG